MDQRVLPMNARLWTRIGGAAAIGGGALGLVFNAIHPQVDDLEDTLAQVQLVADSDIWVLDHLSLMFGVLLITVFVTALDRTITTPTAMPWVRLAYTMQIVAAGTMVVLIGLDGIASKLIFEEWATATGNEREILTQIVTAIEEIDIAIFTTFITVQYGIVYTLVGLAMWLSDDHPNSLGIPTLLLGALATAAGITLTFVGLNADTALPGFGTILTILLWTIPIGIWMLLNTPEPARNSPAEPVTANM